MSNNPYTDTLIGMGLNPKTGLPYKFSGSNKCDLKQNIKAQLRIVDEQDAVNRYKWKNLPASITSQELERMIYYRGQLCLFHDINTDDYYFMPYALDGTIDFYGRFNYVHPLPFNAGKEDNKQNSYLSNIKLRCIYTEEQIEKYNSEQCCVLISDYTKQLSQTCIPRSQLNEGLLDVMSDCIPFMRTNLIASTGIKAVRVNDADQADSVRQANNSIEGAALTGNQFVPITGTMEFQELTDHPTSKSEEFMLAMQSLDNFRLSTYGIDNGGLFQKKAHELQSEAAVNGGPIELVANDGLDIRKHFCEVANKLFGLNMEVEKNVQHEDINPDMGQSDSIQDGLDE